MNLYRTVLFSYILIFFLYLPCASGNTHQQGVSFGSAILQINGEDTIIQSCDFNYYHCPPERWEQRLTAIRQAGFNAIRTDVPWNYHEPVENQVDMRELDAFLNLCCRMGFYIIVSPGLTINSECDRGGLPAWLNAKGLRFPSNDPDFMYYVRHWYENVVPVIQKHQLNNGGSIILVQIENEKMSDVPFKKEMLRQVLKILRTLGLTIPIVTSSFPETQDNQSSNVHSIINTFNSSPLYKTNRYKKPANNLTVQWLNEFGLQSSRAIPQPNAARILRTQKPVFQKLLTSWKFKKLAKMDWDAVWIKSSTAPADWETITIGNNYEHSIPGYDGYVGYQTTIDIPPEIIPKPLYLNFFGAGDNIFVFINGSLAGKHYRGSDEFTIECKNVFRPGSNAILIVTEILPPDNITNLRPRGIFKSVILASEIVSPHPVEISEEVYNQNAFIYLFNTSTVPQLFQFEYTDPITKKVMLVPKKSYFRLKQNDRQFLTGNVTLGNTIIRYATSQILGTGKYNNQDILVFYGEEDQPGEMSLQYKDSCIVTGISKYEVNQNDTSITLYYDHREIPYSFCVNNVIFLIVNAKNAMTTWMVSDDKGTFPLALNNCLLRNFIYAPFEWKYEILCKSGENSNCFIAPSVPKGILLDGTEIPFTYNITTKLVSFNCHSPAPLLESIVLQNTNDVEVTNAIIPHTVFITW